MPGALVLERDETVSPRLYRQANRGERVQTAVRLATQPSYAYEVLERSRILGVQIGSADPAKIPAALERADVVVNADGDLDYIAFFDDEESDLVKALAHRLRELGCTTVIARTSARWTSST